MGITKRGDSFREGAVKFLATTLFKTGATKWTANFAHARVFANEADAATALATALMRQKRQAKARTFVIEL